MNETLLIMPLRTVPRGIRTACNKVATHSERNLSAHNFLNVRHMCE